MSYIYDKVKEALGGSNFRSGEVIKDWSPNEVRAIYLMRDFILVADFLKQPKIVPLDTNEVVNDLKNPSRRGFINNILSDRQLSCMEEIYVDSVYSQYKNLIDLDVYIQSIVSEVSRLRYYGYIQGISKDNLYNAYSQAFLNSTFDFSLGSTGVDVQSTENDSWYKKYNLRSNYYALDGEKGRLNVYFTKCKNYMEGIEREKANRDKFKDDFKIVYSLLNNDLAYAEDISLVSKFAQFLKGHDSLSDIISKSIEYAFSLDYKNIKGISKDLLKKVVKEANIKADAKSSYIIKYYDKLNVYDDSNGVSLKDIYKDDGLIQFSKRLDEGLTHYIKSMVKNIENRQILFLSCGLLPECEFSNALKSVGLKVNLSNGSVTDGLVNFIFRVCGYTKEDFINYVSSKRGE